MAELLCYIMKLIFFSLMLSTSISFSQSESYKEILKQGNDAFLIGNFDLAKEKYLTAYKLDSTESDALYNLAAIELRLNNMDSACQLLQKSYKLKDFGAGELIEKHCGKIEYNRYMFFQNVDSMPKFENGDEELLLVTKTGINPELFLKFKKNVKKSSLFRELKGRKIFVIFTIDLEGNFKSRVTGKNTSKKIDVEINRIFNEIADYIPCQYDGKNVGMWNGYSLPITF